ncbi:uncharacterized protein N7482_001628 [Penicillium canariense]|uniref:Uncharacterized protein n=1 Tax=Penicillium canariense TaxID=189055 RepID=A0A9W9IK35_9EURO|nr:uncharacterized protein N7482_001628 [Penicillium canariense]KAJ5175751.1 hypothetical protein N7482_001628 [Penicillium canariense]
MAEGWLAPDGGGYEHPRRDGARPEPDRWKVSESAVSGRVLSVPEEPPLELALTRCGELYPGPEMIAAAGNLAGVVIGSTGPAGRVVCCDERPECSRGTGTGRTFLQGGYVLQHYGSEQLAGQV